MNDLEKEVGKGREPTIGEIVRRATDAMHQRWKNMTLEEREREWDRLIYASMQCQGSGERQSNGTRLRYSTCRYKP